MVSKSTKRKHRLFKQRNIERARIVMLQIDKCDYYRIIGPNNTLLAYIVYHECYGKNLALKRLRKTVSGIV